MKVRTVISIQLAVIGPRLNLDPEQVLAQLVPTLPVNATLLGYSLNSNYELVTENVDPVPGVGIQRVTPSEQIDPPAAGEPAPQKKARKPKAEKPAAAEQTQEPEKNPNFKQFTGDDVRNALRAALAAGVDGDDVNQLLIKRGYDNISAIGENQKVFANIIEEAKKLIARAE